MHFQNGSPAEPLDPSRLPYNAIGFPVPPIVTIGTGLLAFGAITASFFTKLPTLVAVGFIAPFVIVCLAALLYSVVQAAVHAGVRLADHDSYLDEQVIASDTEVRAGYLSPERAAQVARETA